MRNVNSLDSNTKTPCSSVHRQRGLFGGQGQGGEAQVIVGEAGGGAVLSPNPDVSPESKTAAAIKGSARPVINRDLMRSRMLIASHLLGGTWDLVR
jgi:hypothetical protein